MPPKRIMPPRRRDLLTGLSGLGMARPARAETPADDGRRLVTVPGKAPLARLSESPLILETPVSAFRAGVTANDQFFVRYHHPGQVTQAALDNWALEISGPEVERVVTLRWSDLNDLPRHEVTAVCESAGNRRGLIRPPVEGPPFGLGGVGCAAWHGARLRDVLQRAGVKPGAREVWFDGADRTLVRDGVGYRRSLPLDKALADETLVATAMNGAPLPLLNGAPARLVVPGWAGSYWIKHLTRIVVESAPLNSPWMTRVARIAPGRSGSSPFPSQDSATSWPVTELVPYAMIARPLDGDEVERSGFAIRGVAWDRGDGILRVDVSSDGGKNWQNALLDRDLGRFAFRPFQATSGFLPRGPFELVVRTVTNKRIAQPDIWPANEGGFLNNVPQRLSLTAV